MTPTANVTSRPCSQMQKHLVQLTMMRRKASSRIGKDGKAGIGGSCHRGRTQSQKVAKRQHGGHRSCINFIVFFMKCRKTVINMCNGMWLESAVFGFLTNLVIWNWSRHKIMFYKYIEKSHLILVSIQIDIWTSDLQSNWLLWCEIALERLRQHTKVSIVI